VQLINCLLMHAGCGCLVMSVYLWCNVYIWVCF